MCYIDKVIAKAEVSLQTVFDRIEQIELTNTKRVLDAFVAEQVAPRHFMQTTGYGYGDIGRDVLERIFARLFNTEAAIVRAHIASGTHAITLCLFGLALPGDHILSVTGKPYDTLDHVLGVGENDVGSLKEMGVGFSYIDLLDGHINLEAAAAHIRHNTRIIMVQRSRGYSWRRSLMPEDILPLSEYVKANHPNIHLLVDNCYGEFVCDKEPSDYGADVCVGSLIKNPGGGLAPTGGYIVGTKKAIRRIEAKLTSPGIGREIGSYAASYQPFYQGIFMAPHTVAQALKTAALAAAICEAYSINADPTSQDERSDIIQAIKMQTPERLVAFCQGLQSASPIDSMVIPEPWDMPGYACQVIMAAGTFVSGASIELSADAPMQEPYIAYLQGGLTYAHGKTALRSAFERLHLPVTFTR